MKEGGQEPLGTPLGIALWCVGFFVPFFLMPWAWYAETGEKQKMIGGLPEFAARIVLGNICCTSVLIAHSFMFWRGEEDVQADRDALARGEKLAFWKTISSIGANYDNSIAGMRKMSSHLMMNPDVKNMKIDASAPGPNSTIDHLRAKKNAVVPTSQPPQSIPGAVEIFGDVEEEMTS